MLGEKKIIKYGMQDVETFIPYTLNGLYITSKPSDEINQLVREIESLMPFETSLNRFFLTLIQDVEMLASYELNGSTYNLSDLYAPSSFNLFHKQLKEMQEIYAYAPEHINKLGYANRFLKDLHHALYSKNVRFYPGEFRKTVSFLGSDTIENAYFVSCEPEHMQMNMDEMELFMYRDDISVYVRSALMYYQIMANLPFLIGNQDIARLSSQLYLMEFGGIPHYIPLSRFLEDIEDIRFEALRKGDVNIFIIAYLKAIKEAIESAQYMIKSYNRLKKRQQKLIENSDHTIYQKRRLQEMLIQSHRTVYLDSEPLQETFGVLNKTIIKRYRFLMELGILEKKKTYFENQYYNKGLLRILK